MWEHLKKYHRKSEHFCCNYLKGMKEIYVTWDTLEDVIILSPKHWNYPPKSLLKIYAHEFNDLLPTFPEDVYFFDESFDWTIIFTHEDIFEKKRYCLMIP